MIPLFQLIIAAIVALLFFTDTHAENRAGHLELLSQHFRLEKPKGEGPFPAVIMVSGCSGFDADFAKAHYDSVQRQLVDLGFATLRVDFLSVRNANSCAQNLSASDIADDICIVAEYLHSRTFVKKGAINLLAWSYGAAGAIWSLRRTPNRAPAIVDAVIVYYPSCEFAPRWESEVPVLVLAGSLDNVAPFRECEILFAHLPKSNKLTVRVYDGAHHDFDNSALPSEMQYRHGTLGYNETAAKSAWNEVLVFLKR